MPQPDLACPIAWRRSLRAARERRAAAAAFRRRRGRSGVASALLVAGLLAGGGAAVAHTPNPQASAASRSAALPTGGSAIAAAQRALGIPADGVAGPQTRRAVRRFQRAKGLTVDGVLGPQTYAALGVKAPARGRGSASAAAARSADAGSLLESIALCESGGDPTVVSANGRYRGKYQFSRATWRAMGGSGDPAKASEAEQDRRAAKLLAQRGAGAWPACARKLGA